MAVGGSLKPSGGAERPAGLIFFKVGGCLIVSLDSSTERLAVAVEEIRDILLVMSECLGHLTRYAFEDLNDDRKFECGHEHQPSG